MRVEFKAAFTPGQHVAEKHVARNMLPVVSCQFVVRLLLDTKGYMLPRYRQHVALV